MDKMEYIRKIITTKDYNNLPKVIKGLNYLFEDREVNQLESITSFLVDAQFLAEIEHLPHNVNIAFGKSLRDIKCSIKDEDLRTHEIYLRYDGIKKLKIVCVDVPFAPFLDQTYNNIEEVVNTFLAHVKNLQSYFYELENIDSNCVVLEPTKPTFKDDYRNIRIDDKTWVHVEVTPDGFPTNVYLIGQSETNQDKLQTGVLNWDHDKNIVENIMLIFDLNHSDLLSKAMNIDKPGLENSQATDDILCGICFCTELSDNPGIPQPLCQNSNCDVHFHKHCLFQWLVACEGGRPPAFGVINGSCPTCLQPISCNEKD